MNSTNMTSASTPHKGSSPSQDTALPFSSPKRKRESCDGSGRWGSPTRLCTQFPSRPFIGATEDLENPTSPRTKVSDQLQTMKLDVEFSLPISEFGKSARTNRSSEAASPSAAYALASTLGDQASDMPNTTSTTSGHSSVGAISASDHSLPQAKAQDFLVDTHKVVSALPIPSPHWSREVRPISPSLTFKCEPSSPSRVKSPPPTKLNPAHSDLVWTAAEITGHNPTDPADDGYGINGIGFRPTPAIAQARAQKRRQQVTEWKSREAREARQRRLEKRNGLARALSDDIEKVEQDPRRVRFVEG